MTLSPENELRSSRELDAPVALVYKAFADPQYLKLWWGPEGFTNTIHEFDLKPNGKWLLTMHGPEKGNYENSSVFKTVIPEKLVGWTRLSQPLFDMEVSFEALGTARSKISFRMIFANEEACRKIKNFVLPNNEENFDRLEKELLKMKSDT